MLTLKFATQIPYHNESMCTTCLLITAEVGRPILGKYMRISYSQKSYLPYLSLAYNSVATKSAPAAFHRITGSSSRAIPYPNHMRTPAKSSVLNIKLISRALFSLKTRTSCGIKLHVTNAPANQPSSSDPDKG